MFPIVCFVITSTTEFGLLTQVRPRPWMQRWWNVYGWYVAVTDRSDEDCQARLSFSPCICKTGIQLQSLGLDTVSLVSESSHALPYILWMSSDREAGKILLERRVWIMPARRRFCGTCGSDQSSLLHKGHTAKCIAEIIDPLPNSVDAWAVLSRQNKCLDPNTLGWDVSMWD